jgi:type I restriction enzyme S subunit
MALKRVVEMRSGESITSEEIAEQGEYPVFGGNGLRGYTDRFTHDGSYALVGRQGALCGNVNYAHDKFWASEHAVVCRPRVPLVVRWLGELLREMNLGQYSVAAAQPGLSVDLIMRLRVPVPSFAEQEAIATFLDFETAKIDALVAEQERLIELLKEKRQAVISHAVTKGLNPDAPVKDSGVRWLGSIPAHWNIVQSRRMFRVRSERARESDEQLTASQTYGVIRQADFVALEGRRVVEVLQWKENLIHVEPDDFVISMRSFQGGIEWCQVSGSTSYHYVILTPIKHVVPRFFARLFKSNVYIQALRTTTDLIRDGQELRYSHFTQVVLPIVPDDEQRAIADFLDAETKKIDGLVTEAEKLITLLRERRSALISAAVTGQIDVRAAAERSAA